MLSAKEFIEKHRKEITNDLPVELFKGFFVYPIKMKDYVDFSISSSVLKIEKEKEKDPKIISMSYLEYLIYLMVKEEQSNEPPIVQYLLYNIVSLLSNKKDIDIKYGKDKNSKFFISIDGYLIYKKEFDILRSFIMYQNIPSYKDEYINPELKAELEKAEEIKNRGKKMCDIEKQEMAVVIGSSLTLEEVRELTIRKFMIALELIDKKMHYIIAKTAELSGFVEFKSEIIHYLVEDNKDVENSLIDYAQFKNKISI